MGSTGSITAAAASATTTMHTTSRYHSARHAMKPYLDLIRFDKPTGTFTAFWPFAWGLTMAASNIHLPFKIFAVQFIKWFLYAFILRSLACTVNDVFDRNLDAGVERCRSRPLPSGRIALPNAIAFVFLQYSIGIIFLSTTLQGAALWASLIQLGPLLVIYPLLKRVTHWPQLFLGFATYFGAISPWIAVTGSVNTPVLLSLLLSGWCWVMVYDTVYACQDIKDDKKMGVMSTAIRFGGWIRPILACYGIGFLSMLALAGYHNKNGAPFFLVSVGGAAAHLTWQYTSIDLKDPKSCSLNFKRNGQLGWIILAGMTVDYWLCQ